jgi:hypothetical protein
VSKFDSQASVHDRGQMSSSTLCGNTPLLWQYRTIIMEENIVPNIFPFVLSHKRFTKVTFV